jgi:hypothetical protein
MKSVSAMSSFLEILDPSTQTKWVIKGVPVLSSFNDSTGRGSQCFLFLLSFSRFSNLLVCFDKISRTSSNQSLSKVHQEIHQSLIILNASTPFLSHRSLHTTSCVSSQNCSTCCFFEETRQ